MNFYWLLMISSGLLARLNDELDRCADFFVDLHIHELRNKHDIISVFSQVTFSKRHGFNSLVYCTRSNCLDFNTFILAKNSCDSAADLDYLVDIFGVGIIPIEIVSS